MFLWNTLELWEALDGKCRVLRLLTSVVHWRRYQRFGHKVSRPNEVCRPCLRFSWTWYILRYILITWSLDLQHPSTKMHQILFLVDLLKSVAGYESHYATFRWNPFNTMSCNFTMNERVESAFYNNTDRQTVFLIAVNSGAASCVMTDSA